jgi:uncharacterized membrane protein YccC
LTNFVLQKTVWQRLIAIRATGVRTALAVVGPFFIGQAVGHSAVGLMIGLGGLYACISDKFGAGWRTMLATVAGIATAAYAGTLAGPYPIPAILLTFVWTFIWGLAGVWGEAAGNAGFSAALSLSVALGLAPLTPANAAPQRAVEFAAGGALAILLTLVLWRLERQPASPTAYPPLDVRRSLLRVARAVRLRTPVFQHAVRLAVAATLAVAIYKGLRLEHGYWLIITALVIVKQDWAATRQRAGERIVGSLAGGALGILLAATIHSVIVIDAFLLVFCVLAFSHSPTSYRLYVVFLTPFVVLMINIAAPGDWQVALIRIFDTLIGGILALIVAYILRDRTPARE